ncbi:Alpha-kinase family [Phytophthora infestans]|nr:Alpha-kinase family [Phytophthora infestans]
MKAAGASATETTESDDVHKTKSASSIRADAAEAELAKLREQMSKRKFFKFSCKIGWCSHGGDCRSGFEENVELLKRRLAAVEREIALIEHFSVIRFEMERRIQKVVKEIQLKYAKANALDLVIVMDCTGSMGPWIDEVKSAIVSIIDNVKKDHPSANVRVGFVAYRDFCDGVKRLQVYHLTSDVAAVRKFIFRLAAFGGGDGPEDIPGGLEAALAMPFNAQARRIVLVGDSPCHGSRFNDGEDDRRYLFQIQQSPDICAQMREMVRRGIDFTIIEIQPNYTAKMVTILWEEYDKAKSLDGFGRDFRRVSLSKAGDAARFASSVRSSASSSLSASKERSVLASSQFAVALDTKKSGRPTLKLSHVLEGDDEEEKPPVVVVPPEVKPLNWAEVKNSPDVDAVRHSLHFRPGEPVDWKNLNLKHTQQDTKIRLAQSCFAIGAMRSAHALYDCNMGTCLVAKCYYGKAARSSSTSKHSLQNDVKMQIVAKYLATAFSASEKVERGVDFISTCWYEIKNPLETGSGRSMAMFTAEPYIDGEYKKYNNNNGWIRDDGLDLSETAQAFSHFTWQTTFGQLMVVDLQGVGCIFTDPQIHSKDGKFGCGNLSDVGMTAFFATHDCKSACRALGLKPLKHSELGSKCIDESATTNREEDEAKEATKKKMTCSCPLCGDITTVLHSDFTAAYRKGREVYCKPCDSKSERKTRRKCQKCKKKFAYSPYWHSMKGMEPPQSCKSCEPSTRPIS